MYSLVSPRATIISLKKALPALLICSALACSDQRPDVVRRGSGEGSAPSASRAPTGGTDDPRDAVVFLGTSLTAGYGLADPGTGYTALLQERMDQAGLPFRVVNAGVSGDTSRGGLERIDWVLGAHPDVLVIELGANDGLRGLDPAALRDNLQSIIDRARAADPETRIVLLGMRAPPNLGPQYADRFARVFPDLARANDAALVPFLLEGVGGVPALNQADGIHPNPEGHAVLARNVWLILEPLLRERARP